MHEFVQNTFLGTINNFNTAIVDGKFPASGSFIAAQPYSWITFLIRVGTLNSALTVQLQQDSGVTQTGSIKNAFGVTTVKVIAADDDNELVFIEAQVKAALDIGGAFTHLTLDITGAGGGDDYLDIIYLGCHAKTMPVTQAATTTGIVIAG